MSTRTWLLLAAAVLLILGIPAVVTVLQINSAWEAAMTPHVVQTTAPATTAEAKGQCPIPLPDTATNVQYAGYRQWLAAQDYARFEAPVADCVEHAKLILRLHNETNPTSPVSAELHPILGPATQPAGALPPSATQAAGPDAPFAVPTSIGFGPSGVPLPWFDVEKIEKGFIGGGNSSLTPQVWVDTDRGLFYYRMID